MASGIRDKVAIIGMGCTRFGERWDADADALMLEAFAEATADAGIDRDRIDAAWLGVAYQEQSTGKSGLPLSCALRLPNIPVTRVENLCATGTEALRGAVYAVAAGAADIALAISFLSVADGFIWCCSACAAAASRNADAMAVVQAVGRETTGMTNPSFG